MQLQYISKEIEKHILDIAHTIHRHPEISYEEFETTDLLREELEKLNLEFTQQQPVTGVIALLRGGLPGPTIALRADIDALPVPETPGHTIRSQVDGKMHACGHDFHTAALLGTAMALVHQRDTLAGSILFIFQPAEEQCGGADAVINTGIFNDYHPDAFYSMHVMPDIPLGKVGIRPGPMMAAQGCFRITVSGKGGHGALPHLSRNPLLAAAAIIEGLQTIRSRWADPIQPFSLSVCSIHGGSACNIIPDEVVLEGTFRYAQESYGEAVKAQIIRIAESTANARECSAECSFFREIYPLINDDTLTRIARQAAAPLYGEENLYSENTREPQCSLQHYLH